MPHPERAECIRLVRERLGREDMPPKAFVHAFGCQLSVAEGEELAGLLAEMGYEITEDPKSASLLLLHTCAVRENAQERVYGILGSLKKLKEQNPHLILCVTGCMTARPEAAERLARSYKYVDVVIGTAAVSRLPEMIYAKLCGEAAWMPEPGEDVPEEVPAIRAESYRASVPVMYGCENFCSYCIVPYVRGKERSRAPERVLQEVEGLLRAGVKELLLLGQNVNAYGKDLPEKTDFPALLRAIDEMKGDFWVRFMSSHPKDVSPRLLDTLLESRHVERHLHLPAQSGSNRVLSAMNRRYTREEYLSMVRYLRERDPDFAVTSDFIVGFPGETAEEFEETLSLMEEARFDNVYAFIYSPRPGTRAAAMDDPVSAEEKSERLRHLLALQGRIAEENHRRFLGKTVEVLCEGESRKRQGVVTGRTREAIVTEFPGEAAAGEWASVRVTGALRGRLTGERIIEEGNDHHGCD